MVFEVYDNLWNPKTEQDFFEKSLQLTTKEQLFYRTDTDTFVAYWPKGYKGKKSTLQSRNTFIGDYTEKWTRGLLKEYAESKNLFAVQGVICEEIGLNNKSPADVALCKKNTKNQKAEDIVALIEVKMSIVWNWELRNNELLEIGDYSTHQGNPGMLRSDSMLKAIGKAISTRVSGYKSSNIPIIILGNTPITEHYYEKVDHLKKCGIIQGFWSINPKASDSIDTLKCTKEKGFIRMDTREEFISYIDKSLTQDLTFFSSMVSKKCLGDIIVISNKEETLEKKAEKFLHLIRE